MMFQNTLNVDVWSLIFCSIFSFALKINSQELKEYCHLDVFNASCPHGNVIMMQTARYGRMRVGRCLTTSYFIGCYADVLPFMDSECSGKRFCTVKTVDSELLKFHPCRKDLMPYLEAQFTCISTQQWSSEECQSSKHIALDGLSGYISVKLGHKSHGGTADCPWQITAEVGQKIELKLFRFAYTTEKTNSIIDGSNSPCRHSLVIIDGTNQREISLCSGYAREEHVFTSVHSSLQVYVQADTPGGHHRKASTLLYYKAKGCADLEEVPDAELKRTDSTAVVKCKNSLETWHLVCRDNTWIGDVRNCSRSSSTERPNKSERNVSTEFRNKVQYGILIAVSVGLILGVFLGFTLLICMTVYKRRKRRMKDTDLETTRQNTLLRDYSDDKNQYASFLPTNQYSSFIARSAPRDDGAGDGSAPVNSSSQVTPWECSCDVSRVVPCDTRILESGTPDVIYTPRIPMEGVLATCEACRTNEILNSIYSKAPQQITSQANRNTSFMPSYQSESNRQTSNQPVTVSYSTYDTLPSSLPKGNARCLHSVKEEDPINGNTSDYDSINSSNENKENDIEQIVSV